MTNPKSIFLDTKVKFLTERSIFIINKAIEEKAKIDNKIVYSNRVVPPETVKLLSEIERLAPEFYNKTGDILLTATYYLKNIIVLQGLEDGNHRTGIMASKVFLDVNGYSTKNVSYLKNPDSSAHLLTSSDQINPECFSDFKRRLFSFRELEYFFTGSFLNDYILKFEDEYENTIENKVFNYCYKFINNKILKP
jgi:prophage maintenance system killer protein